jgi:hypothetical protein
MAMGRVERCEGKPDEEEKSKVTTRTLKSEGCGTRRGRVHEEKREFSLRSK